MKNAFQVIIFSNFENTEINNSLRKKKEVQNTNIYYINSHTISYMFVNSTASIRDSF